jgi:hypothetical protein
MKNCCTNLAATFVGISLALVPLGHSQTQVQSLFGAFPGDQFGAEAANVGDIDADGFDDFAVGAPFNDTGANNAGQVIVYSGRTQQTSAGFWERQGYGSLPVHLMLKPGWSRSDAG